MTATRWPWDLVEELRALDEWLTKGGFLPADWTPNTRAE